MQAHTQERQVPGVSAIWQHPSGSQDMSSSQVPVLQVRDAEYGTEGERSAQGPRSMQCRLAQLRLRFRQRGCCKILQVGSMLPPHFSSVDMTHVDMPAS